jgi:hypothetical protein
LESLGHLLQAAGAFSLRVKDDLSAPAIPEIVECTHLAGHFQRISIDRVMPSLDVHGTGPVDIAKAWCTRGDELLLTELHIA